MSDVRSIRTKIIENVSKRHKTFEMTNEIVNEIFEAVFKRKLEISIEIELEYWETFFLNHKASFSTKQGERFRLNNNGCSDTLTNLFRQHHGHDFKCYFTCISNWFRAKNSRKKNAHYWLGSYDCIDKNCLNKFRIYLLEEPTQDKFSIFLESFGSYVCHLDFVSKKESCRGENRKKTALASTAIGPLNTNYLQQDEFKTITSDSEESNELSLKFKSHIYNQVKSEFKYRNRLSVDIFSDAIATKRLFNMITNEATQLKGFIHHIGLDPFGFLLISEIQVNIFLILLFIII